MCRARAFPPDPDRLPRRLQGLADTDAVLPVGARFFRRESVYHPTYEDLHRERWGLIERRARRPNDASLSLWNQTTSHCGQ